MYSGGMREDVVDPGPRFRDRYELGEELGRGAFGRVFRARPKAAAPPAALKALERDAPGFEALFESHYDVLRAVAHPHVIGVLELGEHDGRPWILMELADDGSLAGRLAKGALPPRQAAPLAAQVLDGLAACHAARIVHRGLKTASVLAMRDGSLRLAGLSRAFTPRLACMDEGSMPVELLPYAPPEALEGGGWTQAGDLYAAGAVLFEMLAGQRLVLGRTAQAMRDEILAPRAALDERLPTLPGKLVAVLERALDPDPDARPDCVEELVEQLETAAPGLGWAVGEVRPLPVSGTRATLIQGGPSPTERRTDAGVVRGTGRGQRFPAGLQGRFLVERLIGEGGTGQVWLARQAGLDRPVAIKIVHADLLADDRMVQRFVDEARTVAALHHPGIVRILDFGAEDGLPWIAYEFLPGSTLRERLRDGPLEIVEALELGIQLAEALDEVHAHGVIHRDVKPENLMEAHAGQWKLIDFGIARHDRGPSMPATGGTIGTPAYVAPEMLAGGTPVPQSDMYALGVMLFEIISGQLPFDDPDPAELLKKKRAGRAPQLHSLVPEAQPLSWIVDRLLSNEPSQRFVRATDVSRFLRALLED
jgi:serine/threonine protein kinase